MALRLTLATINMKLSHLGIHQVSTAYGVRQLSVPTLVRAKVTLTISSPFCAACCGKTSLRLCEQLNVWLARPSSVHCSLRSVPARTSAWHVASALFVPGEWRPFAYVKDHVVGGYISDPPTTVKLRHRRAAGSVDMRSTRHRPLSSAG